MSCRWKLLALIISSLAFSKTVEFIQSVSELLIIIPIRNFTRICHFYLRHVTCNVSKNHTTDKPVTTTDRSTLYNALNLCGWTREDCYRGGAIGGGGGQEPPKDFKKGEMKKYFHASKLLKLTFMSSLTRKYVLWKGFYHDFSTKKASASGGFAPWPPPRGSAPWTPGFLRPP